MRNCYSTNTGLFQNGQLEKQGMGNGTGTETGIEFAQKSAGQRQYNLGLVETLLTNISREDLGLTVMLFTN